MAEINNSPKAVQGGDVVKARSFAGFRRKKSGMALKRSATTHASRLKRVAGFINRAISAEIIELNVINEQNDGLEARFKTLEDTVRQQAEHIQELTEQNQELASLINDRNTTREEQENG